MLWVWTKSHYARIAELVRPLGLTTPWRIVSFAQHLQPTPQDVVLVLGSEGLERLRNARLVPRNRTLSTLRGVPVRQSVCPFLVSYDPALADKEAQATSQIQWDFRLACRLHDEKTLEPKLGQYEYVPDLSPVLARIEQKRKDGLERVPVHLDLETMGRYPWYASKLIVSSSWTVDPGRSFVVYHYGTELTDELRGQLHELLTSSCVRVWGTNGKYDLLWLRVKWGLECTNYVFDTTLAGSLLDENRANSLNTHAKLFTSIGGYDDTFNRTWDKGEMQRVPKEALLPYAGGDTDAGYRVSLVFQKQLRQDPRLLNFYLNLLHPAARAFERVEFRGLLVDAQYWSQLRVEVEAESARLRREQMQHVPWQAKAKYWAGDLKPVSGKFLREVLFGSPPHGYGLVAKQTTGKLGLPSTSMRHLRQFRKHRRAGALIRSLEEHGTLQKLLDTYLIGFKSHLRPDGRFHPTYVLHAGALYDDSDETAGTNTGRLSARDPAIQTLPKHGVWAKKLRRAFVSPPGMLVWRLDFSQGELRVAACIAREERMLSAYREGKDLHAMTAAEVHEIPLADFMALHSSDPSRFSELRQGGKAGNFGLLYGMGAEGFQAYAEATYGLKLTLRKAQSFRSRFFELYSGLVGWHSSMRELAHNYGFVRSPLGRVRHLPLIHSSDREVRAKSERQAINSVVQSTLSDLCLLAVVLIDSEFPEDKLQVNGSTHDEVYGYVTQDDPQQWLGRVKDCVEHLPLGELFGWRPEIDFPVDIEIGRSLGELEPVIF